ncbi:hypothetical protein T01_15094 [Trichinella spiralis]|uniref:Uncharacterized protein n=1 Tax=Trichinella spiralis TaxID=6334 RepID=A0A0V1B554_TRISP|nr:hypothetical protein T01_3129 [Trichinella spiralis]KRY32119.1 hypothetical protein T01_15094 [Trichinella spiralis]
MRLLDLLLSDEYRHYNLNLFNVDTNLCYLVRFYRLRSTVRSPLCVYDINVIFRSFFSTKRTFFHVQNFFYNYAKRNKKDIEIIRTEMTFVPHV